MRFIALTGVLASILLLGCPGTERDFSVPDKDADTPVPDAALDVATQPVSLRVVNWNVLNFYNDVRDSLEVAVADEIIRSTAEYQTKLDGIANVLSGLTPDVIVLAEVENQNVVNDLAAKLGSAYSHTNITQGNDPRGIDIAVLSKIDFDNLVSHKGDFFSPSTDPTETFVFARDVLEIHMTVAGRHVVLFGIHFKSGTDADSQLKRLAEAERTREIVTQVKNADPSALAIVLGDFNATPGSPPLVALAGSAPLPLVSATETVPAGERYSVTFGGNKQLYDDQVIDPEALALLDSTFPTGVFITHSSDADAVADHDPVLATYVIH